MSSLFDDFYSSLCNGANEMVPIIHHSMGKAELIRPKLFPSKAFRSICEDSLLWRGRIDR